MIKTVLKALRYVGNDVRPTDRIVAAILAAHAGRDGWVALPERYIAELAGCSERSVRRAIRHLERLGVLEVERVPGFVSAYRVLGGNDD